MVQKDYLLRMIEMLAELIAGILELIKKGDYRKASLSLDNTYQVFLKQDTDFIQSIPTADLINTLIKEHNFTNGHLEILSELYYAQAELSYAKGNQTDSFRFYEKSLILLEHVIKESKTFSFDRKSKGASIQNRINELKNGDT